MDSRPTVSRFANLSYRSATHSVELKQALSSKSKFVTSKVPLGRINNDEQKYDLEALRPAEHTREPDSRNTMFVRIDRTIGSSLPMVLADHHELISALVVSNE
jgi:hypothetical protein